MKKELIFKKLFVLVLAIIAIGYVSCKKPESEPKPEPDYREKWVGSYECERRWAYLSRDDSGTILIVERLSQSIVNVVEKGDFILNFSQKGTKINYDAKVNTDGSFRDYYGLVATIHGNFIDDSLFMTINDRDTIQMGEYKGKKNIKIKKQ